MADWEPNLNWVTPQLAIGGSFPIGKAEHLARTENVRAVVDLRVEDRDDEAVLRKCGLTFLHLPTEDDCAVSLPMLHDGVAFTNRHLDRDERVLIHCEYGIGRSATLALCVLVSRGMKPLEALELAKSRRRQVSPNREQFDAWVGWMREWKAARGTDWEVPDFDAFKTIAYRHLWGG